MNPLRLLVFYLPPGGTDFHGANHKKVYPVGTCTTPDDQIARIEELARKRKK